MACVWFKHLLHSRTNTKVHTSNKGYIQYLKMYLQRLNRYKSLWIPGMIVCVFQLLTVVDMSLWDNYLDCGFSRSYNFKPFSFSLFPTDLCSEIKNWQADFEPLLSLTELRKRWFINIATLICLHYFTPHGSSSTADSCDSHTSSPHWHCSHSHCIDVFSVNWKLPT